MRAWVRSPDSLRSQINANPSTIAREKSSDCATRGGLRRDSHGRRAAGRAAAPSRCRRHVHCSPSSARQYPSESQQTLRLYLNLEYPRTAISLSREGGGRKHERGPPDFSVTFHCPRNANVMALNERCDDLCVFRQLRTLCDTMVTQYSARICCKCSILMITCSHQ
eukprot:COSAG02_NODE_142_length_34188_cov_183.180791_6_plen_166_part_00